VVPPAPAMQRSVSHFAIGTPPGCGAFLDSATMPKPMPTSSPQPAMSYQKSLTPFFVAVLPPPPPPPPPRLMVCNQRN